MMTYIQNLKKYINVTCIGIQSSFYSESKIYLLKFIKFLKLLISVSLINVKMWNN